MNYLSFATPLLPTIPILILVRLLMNIPRPVFRKETTFYHEIFVIIFWFYLIMVFHITLNIPGIIQGHFSISETYNLSPLAGINTILSSENSQYVALNIWGNILMFMPFGFLLPLLWHKWTFIRVFFFSMLVSISIETIQFFTGRGLDIDDVFLNTAGGSAGYLVFWIIQHFSPNLNRFFRIHDVS